MSTNDLSASKSRELLFRQLRERTARGGISAKELTKQLDNDAVSGEGEWDARSYALNSELKAIRDALSAIEIELSVAVAGKNRVINKRNPICRLPEHLLAKIFCEACRYSDQDDWVTEFSNLASISATCHRWRTVALDTPTLWTRIIIKPDRFDPLMHVYLVRSKEAAIRLTIKVYNHFMQWSPQRMQSWMDALAPYLKRCVSLYLEVPDYDVIGSILPLSHPMPLLGEFAWLGGLPSLYGESDDHPVNQEPLALYDPTKCSPHSIRVSLIGKAVPIRWDDTVLLKLHTLVLDNMAARPTRDIIGLIARCANLKQLRWKQRVAEDEAVTETLPPFKSLSVEVLDIDVPEGSDEQRSILWRMDLPNLRYLCIASRASDIRWAEHSLGSTLRFPRLISLWLSKRVFSAEAMSAFLHAHPTVEEFGCGGSPQTSTLLSLLTQPQPQLQPQPQPPSEPPSEPNIGPSPETPVFTPPPPPQLHTAVVHPNLRFLYLLNAAKMHDLARLSYAFRSLFQRMDHRHVAKCSSHESSCYDIITTTSTIKDNSEPLTKMVIQLNDESWNRHGMIPTSFAELQKEWGTRRVILSGEEDSVPWRFRPIGRIALSP